MNAASPLATDHPDRDALREQAARLRASGALGKPGSLSRLFDFLLERSLANAAPKELEIAVQVFGKRPDFDVGHDSVVRVYVHKLRKRLDDFYGRAEHAGQPRLAIPKGEYRLILEVPSVDEALVSPAPIEQPPPRRQWKRPALLAAALVVAMLVGAALAQLLIADPATREMRAVRATSIWAPLLSDDLPITIVVGDYFVLGEEDEAGNVRRLVREFFINSREDLFEHLDANPDLTRRYRNLDLTYLPAASAVALQKIAPVLETGKPVRVMLASALNGDVLKTSHVVYVGYLSGLGMLGDPVFAGSQLALGGTFDELVNTKTQQTYVASGADTGNVRYTDYAYFSVFRGPRNNQIVVVSGTRDAGLAQMAEAITDVSFIKGAEQRANEAPAFEGLSEVRGMANTSMSSELLFVVPISSPGLWHVE